MRTVRISLDWTPNTNHAGLYLALDRGYFRDLDVAVEIWTPDQDNYTSTPARRLAAGLTDVAFAPSESVFSLQTAHRPVDARAVAALLHRDASAIAVLDSSSVRRPRDLDGGTYASYNARYEDAIVAAMIQSDGGRGSFTSVTPARLGIWDTLLTGEADATWIFLAWEGVLAARAGVGLRTFLMEEYKIPYGYSPVLMVRADGAAETDGVAGEHIADTRDEAILRFLAGLKRGTEEAVADRDAAVDALIRRTPTHHSADSREMLRQSLDVLAPYLVDEHGTWGVMAADRWDAFSRWLDQRGLLNRPMSAAELADVDALPDAARRFAP